MRRLTFPLLTLAVCVSVPALYAQSMLTHHLHEDVRSGRASSVGQLPADQIMNLNIVLPLRDAAGLDNFLAALYDPGAPPTVTSSPSPSSQNASAPPRLNMTKSSTSPSSTASPSSAAAETV